MLPFLVGKAISARTRDIATMNSYTQPGEQDEISERADKAALFLERLFEQLPNMLTEHEEHERGFRVRCYERWKDGIDLLKMFIVISEEFGSTLNGRERPRAVLQVDYKFGSAIMLHARGVRVANEILALLREGYPDGALSRWRTLHEIAVVSTFLNRSEPETSLRFLAHRGIAAYKALKQYDEYLPRSRMKPLDPGDLDAAKAERDKLLARFGTEFGEDFGWAYPTITKKKEINLFDLEKATGLDHWRSRFRWASDDIHASAKPPFASLGTSEVRRDKPVLLTGSSNSAFTDPAHMCAISLNLANHSIPEEYLTDFEKVLLGSLRILSDRLGETFLKIENETRSLSAEASRDVGVGKD